MEIISLNYIYFSFVKWDLIKKIMNFPHKYFIISAIYFDLTLRSLLTGNE